METPQANLVAGMQWLLSTYTARFNRRHRRFGHLFSGRYKSLVVVVTNFCGVVVFPRIGIAKFWPNSRTGIGFCAPIAVLRS